MTPRVSVVIPTYRRADLLARCLRAVLAQDLDADAYEVVVVDDEPSGQTRAIVEGLQRVREAPLPIGILRGARKADGAPGHPTRWAADPPVAAGPRLRYIAMHDAHGPAAARNAGWRSAQGDMIAFTDDDCVPFPGWLRAGFNALVPGVSGADGRVIVPQPPSPTDAQHTLAALERSRFVTANCFYRRTALVDAGGFDERFRLPWREDSDLYFTLLESGHRLTRATGAVVVHPVRPRSWAVSVREQRKSMYNALLYKKHPHLYRRRVQARPPLRYYAIVGALLTCASNIIAGKHRRAQLAAAIWASMTLEFAAERLRETSHEPSHVAEMVATSAVIPPLSIWWRLRGAWKFRVAFC